MTEDEITHLLETRGLDNILLDNYLTLPFALSVLEDLGYIDLLQYEETDE